MSTSTEQPHRHRFRQFSLRTLMALILLCSIGALVWAKYVQSSLREQRLVAEVERLKGYVRTQSYDKWWTEIAFGKDFFIEVDAISLVGVPIGDDWLLNIEDARRMRELRLANTNNMRVSDAGLQHIRNLRELEILALLGIDCTDAGLKHLGNLNRLKQLSLQGCRINGDGLDSVAHMSDLEVLDLRDTAITDAGIERLPYLPKLAHLELDNTDVSPACLAHLKTFPALKLVTTSGTRILPSMLWYALPHLEDPKVSRALKAPTVIDFVETPLMDVAQYLEDYHRIAIQLDLPALRAAHVSADVPITHSERNKSLGDALREMLSPLGLQCVVRNAESLLITAQKQDWLRPPRLVIGPDRTYSKKLVTTLWEPTVVEFVKTPLEDVCAYLSDYHHHEFLVNDEELAKAPVTRQLRGLPVATALEMIFSDLDVHGVIDDEVIRVHPGPPKAAPDHPD